MGIIWGSFGEHLRIMWHSFGHSSGTIWASFEQYLEIIYRVFKDNHGSLRRHLGLMFGEIEGGGPGSEAPRESKEVWGVAGPPTVRASRQNLSQHPWTTPSHPYGDSCRRSVKKQAHGNCLFTHVSVAARKQTLAFRSW